jgi:hypothetical protein
MAGTKMAIARKEVVPGRLALCAKNSLYPIVLSPKSIVYSSPPILLPPSPSFFPFLLIAYLVLNSSFVLRCGLTIGNERGLLGSAIDRLLKNLPLKKH